MAWSVPLALAGRGANSYEVCHLNSTVLGSISKLKLNVIVMLRRGEGMTFTEKSCVCAESFFTRSDSHILEVEWLGPSWRI